MKVCKFGGTSMASAKSIKIVLNVVNADKDRRFVVASAPGKRFVGDDKVTDLLLDMKRKYDDGDDFDVPLKKLETRFCELERELKTNIGAKREMERIVQDIRSGASGDYVSSRGEYLSGMLFAKLAGFEFVDAKSLVKFKSGILDYKATIDNLTSALYGLDHAVVTGFYGSDEKGAVKTFSRGGSDVTGALVARATNADVYENWTDVDGVYDKNPNENTDAKLIERMTYEEMFALSANGANVLHKDAVFPAQDAGIPICVRNTFNLNAQGTFVVPK